MKKWLDFSDKKGLQLWIDFLQIQSKKTLKQLLHFSDKKEMPLWSDFVQIQAKKSLKKWLDFSDKKGLQLWLDLVQIQSKKHRNNGWISQIKKIAIMVRFPLNSTKRIIETTVGFCR